jgi:hypothetical protein
VGVVQQFRAARSQAAQHEGRHRSAATAQHKLEHLNSCRLRLWLILSLVSLVKTSCRFAPCPSIEVYRRGVFSSQDGS